MKNLAVIILAAGKGTRMKSQTPKVLHTLCGRPMLMFSLDLVKKLKSRKVVAVLGHKHQEVSKLIPRGVDIVVQKDLLGSADAVKQAQRALSGFRGTVLVLYGDNPLLKEETIKKLLKYHEDNSLDATILTAEVAKPDGYGRIVRDKLGSITGITEDKDADAYVKAIKEINTGIVCFDKSKLFSALKAVRPDNSKKEYYLTDVIGILSRAGSLIEAVRLNDIDESLGVNSRKDLAKANRIMNRRILDDLMESGVTIVDPETTFISWGAKIGCDSIIYPFTVIEKGARIGKFCSLGPFCHVREGVTIDDKAIIGNFIEIVRSRFGGNSIAKHFCYLGDSTIGKNVNIGAGVVTANFDGTHKNPTRIKDNAFIGSDTVLVAPAYVGKGAVTGAGSVLPKNTRVQDKTIVVGVPARPLNKKR
ncbi:MAG: NTP transferase domain-containing protein [Candidatus Omnitrophica bacterium]|nr:NTP transferase domain-containing protein [Candidatus Omnitrophota bacterium]MDD5654762.1 NTP transferase domain-containing protein [Candidatus Omnitrophota bacterium]